MLTHAALAQIAALSYSGKQSQTFPLNVSVDFVPASGGDEIVVTLPGTHPSVAIDWLRDFNAWPVWFKGIGPLHAGFGHGAMEAWAYIDKQLRRGALATYSAHSLGGGMAAILAALHAIHRPTQPFRLVTFGQPRVAFANPYFGRLLDRGMSKTAYRRRNDPVPTVPFRPYLHGAKLTTIGETTGDPIGDHSCSLYAATLAAMGV